MSSYMIKISAWFALLFLSPLLMAKAEPGFYENSLSEDAVHFDISPPLRDIEPPEELSSTYQLYPKFRFKTLDQDELDPVVQDDLVHIAAPSLLLNFKGLGQTFAGPNGTFFVGGAPSDVNGSVGPNHYFQIVNASIAIFNKSGTAIYGPVATRTLWSGFGGGCQTNNNGDGIALYDKQADRWIVAQISVSTQPYLLCVAVSRTSDPTGAYARYAFQYANFPDYPKLGVWPDAYYATFNMFGTSSFVGAQVCAFNRSVMLNGLPATQQCFQLSPLYASLLPSDLDGQTQPPVGSPNYLMNIGSNVLRLWKFHVDWITPANSTLTGPTSISVAPFSAACGGGTCIPQLNTTQTLDSVGDRLMYRLAYRNFGNHEAIVANHSVTAGTSVGVRWYEIRSPQTPVIFQQGTFAPDTSYRWMGSIGMDRSGGIAMGYSVSSSLIHPGIRYTARLATDPLGVMGQGEGVLVNGTGSQQTGLDRWGDYTSISVDPVDDCTFWYTNQFLATDGTFNWQTRVGTFKLPGCAAINPDFSLLVTPSSQTVLAGASTSYLVTIQDLFGFFSPVTLSVSGLPSGVTASFSANPTSTTSILNVSTTNAVAPGTYPLVVTGTSGALSHSANISLVVVTTCARANPSVSLSPTSQHSLAGGTLSYSMRVTNNDNIACGQSSFNLSDIIPAGFNQTINPMSITLSPGQSGLASLQLTSGSQTAPGSYQFTAKATNAANSSFVGSAVGTYVVDAPVSNLTLTISPQNATFPKNGVAGFLITLKQNNVPVSGAAVRLAVTGPVSFAQLMNTRSDGTISYSFLTNSLPAGNYTLTATTTVAGKTASTSTTFHISST